MMTDLIIELVEALQAQLSQTSSLSHPSSTLHSWNPQHTREKHNPETQLSLSLSLSAHFVSSSNLKPNRPTQNPQNRFPTSKKLMKLISNFQNPSKKQSWPRWYWWLFRTFLSYALVRYVKDGSRNLTTKISSVIGLFTECECMYSLPSREKR